VFLGGTASAEITNIATKMMRATTMIVIRGREPGR
jgi:hypothetical protein